MKDGPPSPVGSGYPFRNHTVLLKFTVFKLKQRGLLLKKF